MICSKCDIDREFVYSRMVEAWNKLEGVDSDEAAEAQDALMAGIQQIAGALGVEPLEFPS
jgi:hypothetical protein